jgi:biopolymer transport protein ExbD
VGFSMNSGQRDDEPMAQINVTPFVDVVLVLLIIFMITAGMFDFGLSIEVPKTREVATSPKDYPFINVTAQGGVFYNTEPIAPDEISARVLSDGNFAWSKTRLPGIYLRADSSVPWEIIAPIVQACGREKIEVSMVTKPLEKNPTSE